MRNFQLRILSAFLALLANMQLQAQTFVARTRLVEDSLRSLLRVSKVDSTRVCILLELGNPTMNYAGAAITNLDTAYKYVKQAESLSKSAHFVKGQVQANYRLGYIFLQRGQQEKSREVIQKGIDLSKEFGYVKLQADGLHYLGDSFDGFDNETFRAKIRYFYQSVELFKRSGDIKSATDMIVQIAEMEHFKGDHTSAINNLLDALKIYRSIGKESPDIYESLSRMQRTAGNYPDALQYGLTALRIALQTRDSINLPAIYLGLGVIYADLRREDEALKHYEAGLWHSQKRKADYLAINAVWLISQSYIRHHHPQKALAYLDKMEKELPHKDATSNRMLNRARAECYTALKQFDLAEKYVNKMLDYWSSHHDNNEKMDGHEIIGSLYSDMKMFDRSRKHLNKAVELNKEVRSLLSAKNHQLALFKLDSAQGNFRDAIAHFQQYKILTDSLYDDKLRDQIADLQIKHETTEKEQQIELLTKTNQIQQATLVQQSFSQRVSIMGGVLLLLLLVITYNRFRLKHKSNTLLQAKQIEINEKNKSLEDILAEKESLLESRGVLLKEKEWLLKEIHHRVKNNLQIIMSLLNSQAVYLTDNHALSAIQNSQHRVYVISLIHQKLYLSDKIALIEMSTYFREVVDYLSECFNDQHRVRFNLDIAPVELDVAVAVPLALIINEAITNCLKYAFPNGQSGFVTIKVSKADRRNYLLTIADNGIGMDNGINRSGSLGMSLMKGLSKQLGGELQIENDHGLKINVFFPYEEDKR